MSAGPLSVADLVVLADIVNASIGCKPVTILEESGAVSVGLARSIGDVNGNHLARGEDVRDAWLRVTMRSGFERFIPMGDLMEAVREGRVALDYDAGVL